MHNLEYSAGLASFKRGRIHSLRELGLLQHRLHFEVVIAHLAHVMRSALLDTHKLVSVRCVVYSLTERQLLERDLL